MRRRDIGKLMCVALAGASGAVRAQPARMRRIGFLSLFSHSDPPSPERQAFIAGLAERGLVVGKNLEIVYASAEGVVEFLDDVARDLAAKRVEVIATTAALVPVVMRVAPTMPVVMLAVGDPVGLKLVASLARPGGNVTGMSFNSSDLAPKRVQLLQELVPSVKRLAVLFDTRNGNARLEGAAVEAAARKLGLTPVQLGFEDDRSLTAALGRVVAQKADAFYAAFEGTIVARRRHEIAEFSLARKLPAVAGYSPLAEAGCLLSYAADLAAVFRRSADFVYRILAGAKPAQLPVEQADRFELVVNMATARRIGVAIPQSFLLRIDRVIE
ncbi:MAG: ABC transporter substrate-binding protein [Burkholderiales bacterium]